MVKLLVLSVWFYLLMINKDWVAFIIIKHYNTFRENLYDYKYVTIIVFNILTAALAI